MEKDFEKLLAEKFNERTIEPSANAWERVGILRSKPKKKTPIIYWIAAAAVFVIGLGLFSLDDGSGNTQINRAVTKSHQPASEKPIPLPKTQIAEMEPKSKIVQQPASKTDIVSRAGTVPNRKEESPIYQPIAALGQSQKEQKIQEIILVLEQQAKSGKQPTEDDIDLLIDKARRDIASGNGLSKRTDATALLKDSESELDESFRASIFENLFKQKRIRVALSH